MSAQLAQAEKCHYRHKRARLFPVAVETYRDAVEGLARDLDERVPRARGLRALRDYLLDYAGSADFGRPAAQTRKLAADLSAIRYCPLIDGDQVTARPFEGVAGGVSILFQIGAGWYSDRIGKRKGLAIPGYAITAGAKASFAPATSRWHMLFGRTVGWIGWPIRSPARDTLLTEAATPATTGRAFAFHRKLDTLGAILGPLTATLPIAQVSLREQDLLTPSLGALAAGSGLDTDAG